MVGIILGATTVYVIDREFRKAAAFALGGAVLTFFGLMHGEGIGIAISPEMATAYLAVAGIFFACSYFAGTVPHTATSHLHVYDANSPGVETVEA